MATDWAAIYAVTYGDLVRYLHCKVWDADRARDLAQEAFVRALDHDPENPRSFVFTIALNLARDEARRAVRRRHLALVHPEPDPQPLAEAALGALEAEADAVRVRRALARMSERDREALLLWSAGLGYDEIAARTGLARGAVGTTLARARRRLVQAYASEGLDDAASR
jgi:RNA polymerase sigma-70 factor, ECF subfamily